MSKYYETFGEEESITSGQIHEKGLVCIEKVGLTSQPPYCFKFETQDSDLLAIYRRDWPFRKMVKMIRYHGPTLKAGFVICQGIQTSIV